MAADAIAVGQGSDAVHSGVGRIITLKNILRQEGHLCSVALRVPLRRRRVAFDCASAHALYQASRSSLRVRPGSSPTARL